MNFTVNGEAERTPMCKMQLICLFYLQMYIYEFRVNSINVYLQIPVREQSTLAEELPHRKSSVSATDRTGNRYPCY
jgi:hypothetical protein